jgi:hypothetical protein
MMMLMLMTEMISMERENEDKYGPLAELSFQWRNNGVSKVKVVCVPSRLIRLGSKSGR